MEQLMKALHEAQKLIFVQSYALARRQLEYCLTLDPQAVGVHIHLIDLGILMSEGERLLETDYEQVALVDDASKIRLFCRSYLMQQLGPEHNEDVFDLLTKIEAFDSSFVPALYSLGLHYETTGDDTNAISYHERAISFDSQWFLSYFALSQIYYQKKQQKEGDYYFYAFEDIAPYGVYGNFNVHMKLADEFLGREMYIESISAIQTLLDWWQENKKGCPPEVEISCSLRLSKINESRGDHDLAGEHWQKAISLINRMLQSDNHDPKVLLFLGRTLQSYDLDEMALGFYRSIIRKPGISPDALERVVSYYFDSRDFASAVTFLESCYEAFPNHRGLRYRLLMARLLVANIDAQHYFNAKEDVRQAVSENDVDVLFRRLSEVYQIYQRDAEIHCYFGEVYQRLGNVDKCKFHFEKMYEIDPLFSDSAYRWAEFNYQHDDFESAHMILGKAIQYSERLGSVHPEFYALSSHVASAQGNFKEAVSWSERALRTEPWNPEFVVASVRAMSNLNKGSAEDIFSSYRSFVDRMKDNSKEWQSYQEGLGADLDMRFNALVYAKLKLSFLFSRRNEYLHALATHGAGVDHNVVIGELFSLVNSEFDCKMLYVAFGEVYYRILRCETAEVFFERAHGIDGSDIETAYVFNGLARILVHEQRQPQKALEYAKLSSDLIQEQDTQPDLLETLGRAYCGVGDYDSALHYLEESVSINMNVSNAYWLSQVLKKKGENQQAQEVVSMLMQIDPVTLDEYKLKETVMSAWNGVPAGYAAS